MLSTRLQLRFDSFAVGNNFILGSSVENIINLEECGTPYILCLSLSWSIISNARITMFAFH